MVIFLEALFDFCGNVFFKFCGNFAFPSSLKDGKRAVMTTIKEQPTRKLIILHFVQINYVPGKHAIEELTCK